MISLAVKISVIVSNTKSLSGRGPAEAIASLACEGNLKRDEGCVNSSQRLIYVQLFLALYSHGHEYAIPEVLVVIDKLFDMTGT